MQIYGDAIQKNVKQARRVGLLKGPWRKYKSGSLKGLLHPGNNETNLIANFEEIIEMLEKTYEAVVIKFIYISCILFG